MLKGGFVIGAKHGRGVVVVRDQNTNWQMPQFITINGGSVGWQAGIQATDLVLVFTTKKSVQGLLTGKFTIGADASAAAGPVGREASASTDAKTPSGDLFLLAQPGIVRRPVARRLEDSTVDRNATDVYYRPQGGTAGRPSGAGAGLGDAADARDRQVFHDDGPAAGRTDERRRGSDGRSRTRKPAPSQQVAREQLAAASQRLGAMVDVPWRNYLALAGRNLRRPEHAVDRRTWSKRS